MLVMVVSFLQNVLSMRYLELRWRDIGDVLVWPNWQQRIHMRYLMLVRRCTELVSPHAGGQIPSSTRYFKLRSNLSNPIPRINTFINKPGFLN